MRDVDFLPEWYQENRRRRSSVNRQYVVLGLIFLGMIVWNSVAERTIRSASAELAAAESRCTEVRHVCAQWERTQDEIREYRGVLELADRLESRVDVPRVLAELNRLIVQPVAVRSVQFSAPESGRWEVVAEGLAPRATDVAGLVSRLEASKVLGRVHLTYTRQVDPQATGDEFAAYSVAFGVRCACDAAEQRGATGASK